MKKPASRMKLSEEIASLAKDFASQESLTRSAGYVLVVGMLGCLGGTFGRLIAALAPEWHSSSLWFLFILIAIESIISSRWRARPRDMMTSTSTYFVSEWVLIIFALRVLHYLGPGAGALQADLDLMQTDFWGALVPADFLLTLLLCFLAWLVADMYASDLKSLEGDDALIQRSDEMIISNRGEIRKRVTARILILGIGLVVASALADQNLPGLAPNASHSSLATEQTIVLYFGLGLVMMSLVHYAALRAAWAYERIPIDPQIIRRWVQISLLILLVVGLAAYLLPTHYSLGLLDTLAYVFTWLIGAVYVLAYLAMLPIMALITIAMTLMHLSGQTAAPAPMPTMPPIPTPQATQAASSDPGISPVIQSIFFWTVLLTILVYALAIYIRQNRMLVQGTNKRRGWRLVAGVLAWLRGQAAGLQSSAAQVLSQGMQRLAKMIRRSPRGEDWNYVHIKALSPQQKVRFFYLALLRRGAKSGHARQPAETPAEYAHSLQRSIEQAGAASATRLPPEAQHEAEEDLAEMTEAFIAARYSAQEIPATLADQTAKHWVRLRHLLTSQAEKAARKKESGSG